MKLPGTSGGKGGLDVKSQSRRVCYVAGYDEPPNSLKSGMLVVGHDRNFAPVPWRTENTTA